MSISTRSSTDEVLVSLGIDAQRIATLREAGAVS